MAGTQSVHSRYPVTITLESPLHHGAFGSDTGNAVLHRRVPLAAYPDHPGVPAISGNGLRGALRRVVMRDLFALTGLGLDRVGVDLTAKQWDRLYASLANGGHLDGAEVKTNPERDRVLRDAVPALSVLGAAVYSRMLPGRVSVGWFWPRCRETVGAGLVGASDVELQDAESLLTEISLTRHVDRDQQDPASSGVTPMPVTVEALMPGVVLEGSIVALRRLSDVETSVLGWALDQLVVLGGKGGVGFGRVRITHGIPSTAYEGWRSDEAAVAAARVALLDLARDMA
jgi:hypothetical protein